LSRRLEEVLKVGSAQSVTRELTHGFHSYAGRLHPSTARAAIKRFARPGGRVLDPFCGSGTVLVEGMVRGCRTIGRDVSPLAVRLTRLKATPCADSEVDVRSLERRVRAAIEGRRQTSPPASARREFHPHVAWELAALRDAIAGDDALELCFPSILVKLSKRDSKKLPHGRALRLFADRVQELSRMRGEFARAVPVGTPAPDVREGDARALADVPDGSVDVVLTSPPYEGAYRYTEGPPFDWLGLKPPAREIGDRSGAYAEDMSAALRQIRRVLAPGGCAYLVWEAPEAFIRRTAADFEIVATASQPRVRGTREYLVMLR
jgi:SAM-dependent methyltransferase